MTFLIDTARLHDVGRSFGLNGNKEPENYIFAAIGEWAEPGDGLEDEPSAYRV